MAQPESRDVTRLLESWSDGDKAAFGELVPIVYRELRGLAASYIRRERTDHTLQPTALVHEAYLRLVDQTQVHSPTRAQFFAVAANLMRQILVNHAERHRAVKRGGGNKVALEDGAAAVAPRGVDLIALDQALDKLAQLDPRQGRIVELRFFGGLTEEEIVPPRYSVTPPQQECGVAWIRRREDPLVCAASLCTSNSTSQVTDSKDSGHIQAVSACPLPARRRAKPAS